MEYLPSSEKSRVKIEPGNYAVSIKTNDFIGAPGAIPTRDLPLRRRTLYATELREPNGKNTLNTRQETEGKRGF